MDIFNNLAVILGSSWTSGINLYLTAAGLGILDRIGLINLPGSLDALSNPLIIGVALVMYLIEFVVDKVPYLDSAWDSIHTFIRPLGGAGMAYLATQGSPEIVQTLSALLGGGLALESHLAKASTRAAINTSPEPVTNSVASVSEDVLVGGVLYLIVKHPVIATIVIVFLILFAIWLLKKMFKFIKAVFRFLGGKRTVSLSEKSREVENG